MQVFLKKLKRFRASRTWMRFKSIKRAYYSFALFVFLILFSTSAEIWVNSRALLVFYQGSLYFPTYLDPIPGKVFGEDYEYETNYRLLQKKWQEMEKAPGFIFMPLIPFNPYETDSIEGEYPPFPPSISTQHFFGSDTAGRDVLARLVYGFRIAILFALVLVLCNYAVGISLGTAMGYFGGSFDILMQRLIEIWSNIPFLYVVIIMSSLITPNFFSLILIMLMFGWMPMTSYMRTASFRERERDYAHAARALGAGNVRIMFRHILPNTISIAVSFVPFSMASSIVALTSLDYLGFGLPPPTPSWGELLSQGVANLSSTWIASSVVCSMILILTMITFIGEGIREAFDPKSFSFYK